MRKNKGFTLLEVMIAVFVLAIGLLGIAALQMTGVKNNHTANIRTQATQLSYNLADRIRANIEGTVAGNYLAIPTSTLPNVAYDCLADFTGITAPPNKCSANQMALADLDQWFALATASIPLVTGAGNTQITCTDSDVADADPCTRGSIMTILITWNEQDGANGLINKSFSMDFQP
jgi:type IV pilus assembly protein PilV